ncbi:carboxylesterase/lipase family protein [Celerinatantimonas sp. YJH-8]|uniref:carboxylesterase/lipase family protein n=1 Tax=Celerinatantimonas sp. YJH-8 TaxID=3228714 RepID=UPI0038C1E339
MKARWLVLTLALISQLSWAAATVQIQSGRIEGTVQNGVESFLGIPYARPPLGNLRWQRALSAKSWSGVKKTIQFGPSCMQAIFKYDRDPLPDHYSEDCLTINVLRPAHLQPRMPVMVWIHGGGFVNGGSASPVYNGESFAKQGIIFVSFNYRLGRFGFFAHPALSSNMFHGNYGLMDQISALRWVQDNIASFGGDPKNVTLFGESAGGYSIHALLTSHYSRDLFNRVIIQSGGGRLSLTDHNPWSKAIQSGIQFAKNNGITDTSEKGLAQLRQLPAKVLQGDLNLGNMAQEQSTYSGTVIDGKIIAHEPETNYQDRDFSHVPILVGANQYDLGIVTQNYSSREQVLKQFGDLSKQAEQAYAPSLTPEDLAYRISMQQMMVEPARFIARQFASAGQPVWEYRFAYVAKTNQDKWLGAFHATEIPYVFNTLPSTYGTDLSAQDQAMADLMHQYWVNFAKTGNPNGKGLPRWPQYDRQHDQLMMFSAKGAAQSKAQPDPMRAQLDLVEQIQ